MADKSFNNVITTRNVSLAITQILAAPSTQTWSPTRITLSNTSLPTGFRHLGAVVEDSVNLTYTKELFQLYAGLPRVLQYSAVVGVTGRLEAMFHSFSQRTMYYAMGNVDAVNVSNTIYALYNTAQAYTSLALGTVGHSLAVGDVVVAALNTTALLTSDNEAQVSSIGTGANTLTVYLTSPGFLDLPYGTWMVGKADMIRLPAGTSKQKEFHILGVADTIDGYQIVHDLQKVRVGGGDVQDAMRPTENGRIAARWELFGYNSTAYGTDTELIVYERFWFPK